MGYGIIKLPIKPVESGTGADFLIQPRHLGGGENPAKKKHRES